MKEKEIATSRGGNKIKKVRRENDGT